MVAGGAAVLGGDTDPLGAGRVPLHLLLLSRRLLQGVLGGSAVVRRRRAAQGYRGENSFPLILQNVHRYFLYLAVAFLFVLAWDVWKAMWFTNTATGQQSFGIGVGTLVLAAERGPPLQLSLGCHSFRHLVGGRLDQFSRHPTQAKAVRRVLPAQLQSHALGVDQPLLGRAV